MADDVEVAKMEKSFCGAAIGGGYGGTSICGLQSPGISPADLKYFEGDTIWCRDGSRSFLRERLNDNFCDCADGTDEPGTSACPDSKFYCRNTGSTPKVVYASRVNDGICDCCDGSDEYEKLVKCRNTCGKTGNKPRENKGMKLSPFQEYPSKTKSYFDRGALLHEQHDAFFFEKAKMLGLLSKVKEMKAVLVLQLLGLLAIFWWQCCTWSHVLRRALVKRIKAPCSSST